MSLFPVSKEYVSYLTNADGEEHRSIATVPLPVTGYHIVWQGTPQWWEPASYPEAEADFGKKGIIAIPVPVHVSNQNAAPRLSLVQHTEMTIAEFNMRRYFQSMRLHMIDGG
jgi:hypothetical protein